jgi:hypothetical protein
MITKAQCVEWIAALRGGKYRQGSGVLRKSNSAPAWPDAPDTYCCLGVLGNILVETGGYVWGIDGRYYSFRAREAKGSPPRDSYSNLPLNLLGSQQDFLITMNDVRQCAFPEIANYIEEEILPKLED